MDPHCLSFSTTRKLGKLPVLLYPMQIAVFGLVATWMHASGRLTFWRDETESGLVEVAKSKGVL
jgi:hypothetical protein